ncbi:MAG: hypothetical protein IIC69_01335 [Nanoarchaeota archaeon]|nr:hypothetical protein [Nanoarchaeota archaeon]
MFRNKPAYDLTTLCDEELHIMERAMAAQRYTNAVEQSRRLARLPPDAPRNYPRSASPINILEGYPDDWRPRDLVPVKGMVGHMDRVEDASLMRQARDLTALLGYNQAILYGPVVVLGNYIMNPI